MEGRDCLEGQVLYMFGEVQFDTTIFCIKVAHFEVIIVGEKFAERNDR